MKFQTSKYGKLSIDKYWQTVMYRKIYIKQTYINMYRKVQTRRKRFRQVQKGQVQNRLDTIVQTRAERVQNKI